MQDYENEQTLAAPVSNVYAALTTPTGIAGWWTTDCEVGQGVGARVTVRFGQTYKVFRIDALESPALVRWHCEQAHLHVPGIIDRPDEWVGTTITFRLTPSTESRTRLSLHHRGLTPQIQCFDICSQGWQQFLASLKQYTEAGQGAPYQPLLPAPPAVHASPT